MKNEKYMNCKPLFFLFTCVKNGRRYISKLFDSLLSQTKINFVHYIYEDGSDDPVDDLVYEYSQKAASLKQPYDVIYEKNPINIGLNMSTKHCIDMCFCPFFIWIDCDNFVDSHFFEELEKGINKNKNATVFRTRLYKYDNKSSSLVEMYKNSKSKKEKKQLKYFLYSNYSYSFFAVNADKYRIANPTNYFVDERAYFNDTQVLFSCAFSDCDFVFVKKAIGYYLSRGESESHFDFDDSCETKLSLFENTINHIKPNRIGYFLDLKQVVLSYYKMLTIIKDKPKDAYTYFVKREYYIKKNNIPRQYCYKEHNYLYWFFYLLKKRFF